MKTIVLREAVYFETMRETVEPYLAARGKEFRLERGQGQQLYCVFYRADQPVGTVVVSHGFTETAEKYKENIYYFLIFFTTKTALAKAIIAIAPM